MKLTLEDLGREVYCIYHNEIIKETVLAIGDGFFIPENYTDYSAEYQLIDFRITYPTLEEAKEELEEQLKEKGFTNLIFVQYEDDYWGFEGKDEA